MLPILITMPLSLLLYLCTASLVYLIGPSDDYERAASEFTVEYLAKRRQKRAQAASSQKRTQCQHLRGRDRWDT
jgi:hypothetical protein